MVPHCNSNVAATGQTSAIKTRPKTSGVQRQASLRYINTSKYSSQIPEEKILSSSYPQPKQYDRPKTSLAHGRDKEKVGLWINDRSSHRGIMQSEETPLSGYKPHEVKSLDPACEPLSHMTNLRIKSSTGAREMDSLTASETRQRSSLLLRRLTNSLSSKVGPGSPLRDSLRERWLRISKDNGVRIETPADDPAWSPAMSSYSFEIDRESSSTFHSNNSRCNSSRASRIENCRAPSLLNDVTDKQSGNSFVKDLDMKGSLSSSVKDSGELSHRSESNVSVKESSSVNKRRAGPKRWQSAASRVLKSNRNDSSVLKNSKKDSRMPKREMTSPRIITINRMSTPTLENEAKNKAQDKGDSRGKSACHTSPCPASGHTVQEAERDATRAPWPVSKPPAGTVLSAAPRTVMSSGVICSTSNEDALDSHTACATSRKDPAKASNEDQPPDGNATSSQSLSDPFNTSNKRFVKSAKTGQEVLKNSVSEHHVTSSENMSVKLGFPPRLFGQEVTGHDDLTTARTVIVTSGSDIAPEPSHGPVRSMFMGITKPETICVPFSTAADTDSDSSASTPTVPLSGCQRLGGSGDGAGSSVRPDGNQEAAGGEVGGWDYRSNDLQKLKDLDLHGHHKRPLSRNGINGKEKVPANRSQDELRTLGTSFTGSKPPPLRANGLKTNLLKADSIPSHGATGPEDDLVAMGTLWSPSHQLPARGSSTVTSTATTSIASSAASSKSLSLGNGSGSGGGGVFSSHSSTLPARRPVGGITAAPWQALHHSPSAAVPTMGNIVKSNKDDPKYSDPVPGAPAPFQQRLMELAALEAETVRWERSKKVKKKPLKQDKES